MGLHIRQSLGYDASYKPSSGDIVFLLKGGGIQSAVIQYTTPNAVHLLPLHEQGSDTAHPSELIPRHKYRRELEVMPAKKAATKAANAKAKSKKAEEDEEDEEEVELDEEEEEEEEEESEEEDDEEESEDEDDDEEEDEDEEEEEESDDDEDEEEEEEEEAPKKGKAKAGKTAKAGAKRGPKPSDPSQPFGREGTKRRFLFDAMVAGGSPEEIIKAAKAAHKKADKKATGLDKYDNIGAAAIKGFAKYLGERGYKVTIKDDHVKVGLVKGGKK